MPFDPTVIAQAGPSVLLGLAVWVLWGRLKDYDQKLEKLRDSYEAKLEGFLTEVITALRDLED